MICGCGFVLWCSVGLFYGGCGFVGGGCAVLVLDCVFFFLVQLLGFVVVAGGLMVEVVEVVVAGGLMVGWVSMVPSEWVLG